MIEVHEDILFYAFRYALGRRTYVTATVAECLIDKLVELSPKTRNMIINEIHTAIEEGRAGMLSVDVPIWEHVAATFKSYLV